MGIRGFKEGGIPSVPSREAGTQKSVVLVLLVRQFFGVLFTAVLAILVRLQGPHNIADAGLNAFQSLLFTASQIRHHNLTEGIHLGLRVKLAVFFIKLNFKIFLVDVNFYFFVRWHGHTFNEVVLLGSVY